LDGKQHHSVISVVQRWVQVNGRTSKNNSIIFNFIAKEKGMKGCIEIIRTREDSGKNLSMEICTANSHDKEYYATLDSVCTRFVCSAENPLGKKALITCKVS